LVATRSRQERKKSLTRPAAVMKRELKKEGQFLERQGHASKCQLLRQRERKMSKGNTGTSRGGGPGSKEGHRITGDVEGMTVLSSSLWGFGREGMGAILACVRKESWCRSKKEAAGGARGCAQEKGWITDEGAEQPRGPTSKSETKAMTQKFCEGSETTGKKG